MNVLSMSCTVHATHNTSRTPTCARSDTDQCSITINSQYYAGPQQSEPTMDPETMHSPAFTAQIWLSLLLRSITSGMFPRKQCPYVRTKVTKTQSGHQQRWCAFFLAPPAPKYEVQSSCYQNSALDPACSSRLTPCSSPVLIPPEP